MPLPTVPCCFPIFFGGFPLVLFETAFHFVALAAVELCRLKVFSQRSGCFCLHSGRVISLCFHVHLFLLELRFSCLLKYFYERNCLLSPTTFFFSNLFSFMNGISCMNVFPAFMFVHHLCLVLQRPEKRVLDLWTLELQVVLSCHVCVGN